MARKLKGIRCSFCGKTREQTARLIAGPNGVFICADCVALCNEILSEQGTTPPAPGEHEATRPATTRTSGVAWWRRIVERWQQRSVASGLTELAPSSTRYRRM